MDNNGREVTEDVKQKANLLYAELRSKIMEAFAAEFQSRPEIHVGGQPQIVFQMAYLAALIDVAAVIGVDAGATEDMFKGIADENFKAAYANAPRFG